MRSLKIQEAWGQFWFWFFFFFFGFVVLFCYCNLYSYESFLSWERKTFCVTNGFRWVIPYPNTHAALRNCCGSNWNLDRIILFDLLIAIEWSIYTCFIKHYFYPCDRVRVKCNYTISVHVIVCTVSIIKSVWLLLFYLDLD